MTLVPYFPPPRQILHLSRARSLTIPEHCQQRPAVGTGNMVVSTPNGDGRRNSGCLSVGYMLVSLGAMDDLGYRIAISGDL
jgi:hypothetical protein